MLIAKPGSGSFYRPLCLLNDLGKLFERIIVNRLEELISRGDGLSPFQYGFRARLSTCDAVVRARAVIEGYTSNGEVCVAASLDVRNAFNILAWEGIRRALRVWNFPIYLRLVLGEYLNNRKIIFPCADGRVRTRRMTCKVL